MDTERGLQDGHAADTLPTLGTGPHLCPANTPTERGNKRVFNAHHDMSTQHGITKQQKSGLRRKADALQKL